MAGLEKHGPAGQARTGQADAARIRPTVSVFGSNAVGSDGEGEALAEAVGRKLAELGYAVANGGYGGTMEAGSRGASQAGGHTIGVTCSVWRSRPNAYIREVIETSGLSERVGRLAEVASAGFVVLPGGTGTLLELAWVWEAMAKNFLPHRPVVCVGDFWRALIDTIASVHGAHAEMISIAAGPDDLERFFPRLG
jgi:hypothetical protein